MKPKNLVLEAARGAMASEEAAVTFLEQRRWKGSVSCPRCACADVYAMQNADGTGRNEDFRWRCRGCKKMFTVRTGTVMEESRLPLSIWVYAFVEACSSRKGIAALKVAQRFELSYRTALFLMHRIRFALQSKPTDKMRGTVEADETYVGGKPRWKGRASRGQTGRGTVKTPVVAVVERGGRVVFRVMERLTALDLGRVIAQNVERTARLMTDDYPAYKIIGAKMEGGHEVVKHSRREYARPGGIHSNTVESVFSLVKRGLYGVFHSVSTHHLHRYLEEFAFRHNTRFLHLGDRVEVAIQASQGKRLVYRDSSAGVA